MCAGSLAAAHENPPCAGGDTMVFQNRTEMLYLLRMGCPPVRGDNPRALASGLSYVQVDKHGITILYHLHQCRPCTSRDISC